MLDKLPAELVVYIFSLLYECDRSVIFTFRRLSGLYKELFGLLVSQVAHRQRITAQNKDIVYTIFPSLRCIICINPTTDFIREILDRYGGCEDLTLMDEKSLIVESYGMSKKKFMHTRLRGIGKLDGVYPAVKKMRIKSQVGMFGASFFKSFPSLTELDSRDTFIGGIQTIKSLKYCRLGPNQTGMNLIVGKPFNSTLIISGSPLKIHENADLSNIKRLVVANFSSVMNHIKKFVALETLVLSVFGEVDMDGMFVINDLYELKHLREVIIENCYLTRHEMVEYLIWIPKIQLNRVFYLPKCEGSVMMLKSIYKQKFEIIKIC